MRTLSTNLGRFVASLATVCIGIVGTGGGFAPAHAEELGPAPSQTSLTTGQETSEEQYVGVKEGGPAAPEGEPPRTPDNSSGTNAGSDFGNTPAAETQGTPSDAPSPAPAPDAIPTAFGLGGGGHTPMGGRSSGYTLTIDNNCAASPWTETRTGYAGESLWLTAYINNHPCAGYTLTGWNTEAGGTGTEYAPDGPYPFSAELGDETLYAQWEANPATLKYDSNASGGPVSGSTASTTGVTGDTVTVDANGFARDGYTFTGWNTQADGTGDTYQPGNSIVLLPDTTTLYAQWSGNAAAFTYHPNGGEGAMADTEGFTGETVTVAANEFTHAGYRFVDWNTEADGTGAYYQAGSEVPLPAGTTTLYAEWDNRATASLYGNFEGANPGSIDFPVDVGSGFDPFSWLNFAFWIDQNPGYALTGWNTESDGSGTSYELDEPIFVTNNVDLYAQWAQTALLTYNANGGRGTVPSAVLGVAGQQVTLPGIGNMESPGGYRFTGWNTQANGRGDPYAPGNVFVLPAGATTLYAQWEIDWVTLTYDANGGSGNTPPVTGQSGRDVTVAANGFTRSGYRFVEWNVAADGTGRVYEPGESFTLPPGGATLYAQWSDRATLIFQFNFAGVHKLPAFANVNAGAYYDATSTADWFMEDPPAGYTLIGWNTKADGSGTGYGRNGPILANNNIVLYAQWAETASLTYVANGGEGPLPDDVDAWIGHQVRIGSQAPTRDGYTFAGWNTNAYGNGDAYAAGSTITLAVRSTVLYAQWTPNPSTLTYEPNGGTGIIDSVTGATGEGIETDFGDAFTRAGYTLFEWNTQANGGGASYPLGSQVILPPGGITLYAQWDADPATIVYNANGGSGETDPTSGVTDQTVEAADNAFTREGYTFTEWNTEPDGNGQAYTAGQGIPLPPGETTLYAQWDADPATIVYNANGGNGDTAPTSGVTDQTVEMAASAFTREGYTFAEWNTEPDGNGQAYEPGDEFVLPAGSTTLYAMWSASAASFTYDANGGSGETAPTSGVTDQSVEVAANAFAREGYTFSGWNTQANGEGETYKPGDTITLPPGETTLYAQWDADPATIVYNANGGNGDTAPTSGVTDQTAEVAANTFTREGYTFTEWNTEPDGNGQAYEPGDDFVLPAGSTTLYAQWEANPEVTVRLEPNGGSEDPVVTTKLEGQTLTLTGAEFTRPGYTLAGWTTQASGGGIRYAANAEIALTNNLTLYAQWSADQAWLVYDLNGGGGTVPAAVDGVTGQDVSLPDDTGVVAPVGKRFSGWNTEADGTGVTYAVGAAFTLPAGGVTLYAQWVVLTVSFNLDGGEGDFPPLEVDADGEVTIPADVPTREGYTFKGWALRDRARASNLYQPGDTYTPSYDVTFLAIWEADPAAIFYDANGGSGEMDPTSGVTDQTVEVADNAFTRDGYTFTEWNTQTDGDGRAYTVGQEIPLPPGETTLYAQWEKIPLVTITFTYGVGEGDFMVLETAQDGSVILPGGPTRAGHKFEGWLLLSQTRTSLSELYQPGEVFYPRGDTIFAAQWSKILPIDPDKPAEVTPPAGGNSATDSGGAGASGQLPKTGASANPLALCGLLFTALGIGLLRTRIMRRQ